MANRITVFLREIALPLSILIKIIGIILILMGVLYYWVRDTIQSTSSPLYFVYTLGEWNAYVFVAGWILFGIGLYYLYMYLKRRKFVFDELKTSKRSEFVKRHGELQATVRHLPRKYQRMLAEKEDELNIR